MKSVFRHMRGKKRYKKRCKKRCDMIIAMRDTAPVTTMDISCLLCMVNTNKNLVGVTELRATQR